MREDDPSRAPPDAPILPWGLVGGAFLHFAVPIYLVAVVLDVLLAAPRGATPDILLREALSFSGRFLVGYFLLALLAAVGAALIDPLLRARRAARASRDPLAGAHLSGALLAAALTRGHGLFGGGGDALLDAIRAKKLDHSDARCQMLSRDLEEVIGTSAAALANAPADRRPQLVRRAIGSLVQIEAAFDDLVAEQSRRAEDDAEAVARYVETRYGTSDFSGRAD